MKRNGIHFWAILVLLISVFVPVGSTSAKTLSDIPASYAKEINYLIEKKIITGYEDGQFKPNRLVTREEAATMMGKAKGLNGTQRKTVFYDVKQNSYASGYIQSANDKNIINGYGDGTFKPKNNMTRVEMAFLISKAYNLTNTANVSYSDLPSDAAQQKAIKSITNAGISNGYTDGTFRPKDSITRAEFAVMLARALNSSFKVEPIKAKAVTQYVTVNGLNIRSGPGTGYKSVGSLNKGDKITTYAISGGWAQITAGSVKGYVSTAYITKNAASVKKIIVLDPGHGGKDPGAVANGLREKDIVLSVGLYLRDYLKAAGVEVIMTRTSDVYLTLDERVAIAKNSGADSFVSLHMNAAASTSASGTETYSSTAGDSNRVNSSAKLSQFIQERLVDELGTRDRGEKNADYVVIYKNPLPSVLAEMGFLTNAAEAKYVNAHKKETARAIYLGIMDYYKWAGK